MRKKSFMLYNDSLSVLQKLNDEQAGKLFKAIASYNTGETYTMDFVTELAFEPFKNQFDRDQVEYQKTLERNQLNGKQGGRPKTQRNPLEPTRTQKTHSVIEKPLGPDKDKDTIKKQKRDIVYPTLSECEDFFTAKQSTKQFAQRFHEYYELSNWTDRTGKQILVWKHKAIQWINHEKAKQTNQQAEKMPSFK